MGDAIPELKEVLGALIFGGSHPMTVSQLKRLLAEVGDGPNAEGQAFSGARDSDIQKALQQLAEDCRQLKPGFELIETAEGYRFQSAASCGPWLRLLRDEPHPSRLSRPALETLAIIAYRQPAVRSEIEAVRGVAVDHILHSLLEMQLIRIVGRSELPGRPLLYGTTGAFLEHFGLKDLKELPGIEQLSRIELARRKPPVDEAKPPEEAEEPEAQAVAPAEPAETTAEPEAVPEPAPEATTAGDAL